MHVITLKRVQAFFHTKARTGGAESEPKQKTPDSSTLPGALVWLFSFKSAIQVKTVPATERPQVEPTSADTLLIQTT